MTFIKYPKIYRVGHRNTEGIFSVPEEEIIVEEKIDGANFRFGVINGKLRFGSRKVDLTEKKDYNQFKKAVEFVKNLDISKMRPGHVYFAEYCIPHSIQYNWEKMPLLLGFDVWNGKGWLGYEDKVEAFNEIGIEVVPLVDRVKAGDITPEYLNKVIPESKYYSGKAEGVVFKNYNVGMFAKLVSEAFKEVNQEIFGKSKKHASDDTEYILEKYVPVRRVEKVIQAMINEGWEHDMTMMKELPKRVFEDVVDEEAASILHEKRTIDLKRLRKMIAKRCVNVLQRQLAMKSLIR